MSEATDRPMTDDDTKLRQLAPLARTIDPLPGGLAELRGRIQGRRRRSRRAMVVLAASVACAALAAVWLIGPAPTADTAPDRRAMQRLLVNDGDEPNPRAVAMGLVAPRAPIVASDPRVVPSDAVVFYWVAPATAAPVHAE